MTKRNIYVRGVVTQYNNIYMNCNTKIVATISDLKCDVEFIRSLYEVGMNVVRINTAHASFEGSELILKNVRAVSEQIAILIDTKGPEIRTTICESKAGFNVELGQKLKIKGGVRETVSTAECLYVNDLNIVSEVPVGASLLIDDGDLKLDVIEKTDDYLLAEVMNSGVIKNFKSVNVPGVKIKLPSITPKDEEYIIWAIKNNVDFIAHSFVRHKKDVLSVQEILDRYESKIKIISKIENQEGVDNIEEILNHTYGVMVARGDLGVEIPAEQIPRIQRSIVNKCIQHKRPVIIATQLLQSMIVNPRPTRAEISDIANAIYQRTDAIMLSGETANGAYPVEAVRTMTAVANEIERSLDPISNVVYKNIANERSHYLAKSAVNATMSLPIKAIVIDTMSGRTARYFAAFRSPEPVFTVCYDKNVMRVLALSYGVNAIYQDTKIEHKGFLFEILSRLEAKQILDGDDLIVTVSGDFGVDYGPTCMEISQLSRLKAKHVY